MDALQPMLAREKAMPAKAHGPSDFSPRVEPAPASSIAEGVPASLDFIGEAAKDVLKLMSLSPIDIDELCLLSGLEVRHVNAALLALDLSGRIQRRVCIKSHCGRNVLWAALRPVMKLGFFLGDAEQIGKQTKLGVDSDAMQRDEERANIFSGDLRLLIPAT